MERGIFSIKRGAMGRLSLSVTDYRCVFCFLEISFIDTAVDIAFSKLHKRDKDIKCLNFISVYIFMFSQTFSSGFISKGSRKKPCI